MAIEGGDAVAVEIAVAVPVVLEKFSNNSNLMEVAAAVVLGVAAAVVLGVGGVVVVVVAVVVVVLVVVAAVAVVVVVAEVEAEGVVVVIVAVVVAWLGSGMDRVWIGVWIGTRYLGRLSRYGCEGRERGISSLV